MERDKIDKAIYLLEDMSFKDKQSVYSKVYSVGTFSSTDMSEKLVLISLVALVTYKMREKNPETTALQVLLTITKQVPDNSGFYQFLEGLAVIVEDMSYNCNTFDSCGCKNSSEIITKIKEILSTWLPF